MGKFEELLFEAEAVSYLMVQIAHDDVGDTSFAVMADLGENGTEHECDLAVSEVALRASAVIIALLADLDSWKRLAELRGENWEKDISDLLLARQRIDELEANGEALTVHYQCREIGEGGWMDCDKARYDYCQRRPEMDTRTVLSPPEGLEAKDKTLELEREKSRRVMSENHQQAERIAELEAKLAAPVRLPNKNDDEFWFDGVFQVAKFDRSVERSISAVGFTFTVEGDE